MSSPDTRSSSPAPSAAADGPDPLAAFAAFAARLADAAGAVIRPHFRTALAIDAKSDRSPVTIADRAAEQAMRAMIAAAWPDHGIVGEEFGSERAEARHVWVLDPIDGTKSFISGVPLFGTLIALLEEGRPVLGVIDQPISGERWEGRRGAASTLNGVRIATKRGTSLDRATLFATAPDMFRGEAATRFARLQEATGLTRFGADCYAYGLLAAGCIDLVAEASLKPYDYAALIPIVEGAGGVMTDWSGAPLGLNSDGTVLAAGDAAIHRASLSRLA